MPDASSDIPHSTVLYSLIHTAVRGTANVNSGTAFISDHIIPSIQYSTLVMMSVLSLNCLISIPELDLPLTKKISKRVV